MCIVYWFWKSQERSIHEFTGISDDCSILEFFTLLGPNISIKTNLVYPCLTSLMWYPWISLCHQSHLTLQLHATPLTLPLTLRPLHSVPLTNSCSNFAPNCWRNVKQRCLPCCRMKVRTIYKCLFPDSKMIKRSSPKCYSTRQASLWAMCHVMCFQGYNSSVVVTCTLCQLLFHLSLSRGFC